MTKNLLAAIALSGMVAAGASAANLVANPGFEDLPGSINDAVLEADPDYSLPTFPVTVDASDANFQGIIGIWGRMGSAGNGISAPVGTGNDSNRATGNRKAARYVQILPLGTVSSGQDLLLDWQYVVDLGFNDANEGAGAAVSFLVEVVGLKQATGVEAATTFNDSWGFGGEAANSAMLGTSTVDIAAGAADGVWHSAPQALIEIDQDWDYIGISIKRGAGITNSTAAQTDNVSLQFVPEPASLALFALGGLAMLRRKR